MRALGKKIELLSGLISRHEDTLWWLHSLYALLFGIGVMWLGSRDFAFLRLTVFHIAFIWLTSLLLPGIVNHPRLSSKWRYRVRLLINYFNKNFYQQLLFFLLPVYYASTTFWSRNTTFLVLLSLTAVASTMDIIYDRHLSVKWVFKSVFFAFSLFACINVMLPVLWSISNIVALRISGLLSLAGFSTLCCRLSELRRWRSGVVIGAAAVLFFLAVERGRAYIPPAPLQLVRAVFGQAIDRDALEIRAPVTTLSPEWSGRVYVLTAIKAPLGLNEKVGHRWYLDDRLLHASPFYLVTGGREAGFRLWTSVVVPGVSPGARLRLEVVTEGRQLIGRGILKITG